jgi:hypothetical protein
MAQLSTVLRGLIGQELEYQGIRWRIIEILDEGPQIVLAHAERDNVIQTDQYGQPTRRGREVRSIPLGAELEDDFHLPLGAVLTPSQQESLKKLIESQLE